MRGDGANRYRVMMATTFVVIGGTVFGIFELATQTGKITRT